MSSTSPGNGTPGRRFKASSEAQTDATPRPAGKRFKPAAGADGDVGAPAAGGEPTYRAGASAPLAGRHRRVEEPPAEQDPAPAGAQAPRPVAGRAGSHAAGARLDPVRTRAPRPRRPARSIAPLVAGVLAAVVVAGLLGFGGYTVYRVFFAGEEEEVCTVEDGLEVYVTIESGASGDEIAAALSEAHVIDDTSEYYSAVISLGADQSLQPGVYLFYTHQDPLEVVKQLTLGSNVDGYTLTVAEGLTVESIAAVVEESLGIDAEEFIEQAVASNYVDDYEFLEAAVDDSLEGFLFPKTYIFTEEPTADSVIRKMLDQYETETASLDYETALAALEETYGVSFTEYDILIMASIIEREGLTTDQRYNVSSVFYNRLAAGMYLQSDATMMYVTGGEVTSADLKTDSPYNTYLYEGLPPTPICAPSLESIEAALSPASTSYYYFYITTEAEYFSETYEEHLAAIEAES